MTSVERVVEYTQLESEGAWETNTQPPPDWPANGSITFDRVNFSYSSQEPLVLKNLNVVISSREKVSSTDRIPTLLLLLFVTLLYVFVCVCVFVYRGD